MTDKYAFDIRKLDPAQLEKDVAAGTVTSLVGIGEDGRPILYVQDPAALTPTEVPVPVEIPDGTVTIQRSSTTRGRTCWYCIPGTGICFPVPC